MEIHCLSDLDSWILWELAVDVAKRILKDWKLTDPIYIESKTSQRMPWKNMSNPQELQLGGKFLVHPPLDRFSLQVVAPDHPVLRGIEDFQVEDELYLLETYPGIQPVLVCPYDGFLRPVMWVKPYGLGRVVYNSLGHGEGQLKDPSMKKIFRNAVRWILRIDEPRIRAATG